MMLQDIAEYLQTKGVGVIATNIFESHEPSSPDNCITLYEYAGEPGDSGSGYDKPGLQVRSRNVSSREARAKLQEIQNILQKIGNEHTDDETLAAGLKINGTFYAAIRPTQGVTNMGQDENGRSIQVQSYILTKARN